ncbi:MAG TPA: PASTA domain-containing protein, partial [Firmicutes bacterium]|nr:PASTA domain-containing protein [Bacillota bacterium]
VRGQTRVAAEAALTEKKLVLGPIREEYDAVTPAGLVVTQEPAPKSRVAVGSQVAVVVSLGPPPVKRILPDFQGQDLDTVQQTLKSLNLQLGRISEEPSNIFGAGKVIRTDPPAQAEVGEGTSVNLVVSKGPPPEPQPEQMAFNLKFTVPEGPPLQLVEVWVVSGGDGRRVYRRRVAPGTAVELTVDAPAGSTVRVDIDGRVWREYPVGGGGQ